MARIQLHNVSLSYPILSESIRSFKKDIINCLMLKFKERNTFIDKIHALKNINIEINNGDRVGLIGHNGAGKSTLLKILAGIYDVTDGIVNVEGSVSSVLSSNSLGMQPELNGYENIKISSLLMEYNEERYLEMVKDIEEFTELGKFLNIPVKSYSAGMRARLAFAISTAVQPDILLLDEVVGTGDAKFIYKAQQRIHELIDKSNIFVLASHTNQIIQKFCNKAIWLEHGVVREFGDVDVVIQDYMESYKLTSLTD